VSRRLNCAVQLWQCSFVLSSWCWSSSISLHWFLFDSIERFSQLANLTISLRQRLFVLCRHSSGLSSTAVVLSRFHHDCSCSGWSLWQRDKVDCLLHLPCWQILWLGWLMELHSLSERKVLNSIWSICMSSLFTRFLQQSTRPNRL